MCLKDRRIGLVGYNIIIAFFRELDYGIVHPAQNSKFKSRL